MVRHVVSTGGQVVLVAAVRVVGRVGVVLEEEDVAIDPLLSKPLLSTPHQLLQDSFPCLVVGHHVANRRALRGGVLGM